jgi:amino acid transporter
MSKAATPGVIMIGWLITGIGMLMLAFVYQSLATRKPDLNAGPYAHAMAGFGGFVGFTAWGYWLSASLGNVAYAVAIFSAPSCFVSAFRRGTFRRWFGKDPRGPSTPARVARTAVPAGNARRVRVRWVVDSLFMLSLAMVSATIVCAQDDTGTTDKGRSTAEPATTDTEATAEQPFFFWMDNSIAVLPYGWGYEVDPDEQSTVTF